VTAGGALAAQGASGQDVLLLDVGALLDPPPHVAGPVPVQTFTQTTEEHTAEREATRLIEDMSSQWRQKMWMHKRQQGNHNNNNTLSIKVQNK